MAIASRRFTVTTTRTPIYTAVGLVTIIMRVNASSDVMVGGADLTLANGFTLVANGYLTITLKKAQVLYGIASTGQHDIFLLFVD